jgi:hypothetical protein
MSTPTPGFYKKSRPSAEYGTVFSAYDHADTIAAAVEAYKRARTTKYFILVDGSPDLATITCTCGNALSEGDGNRCQFTKRDGQAYVLGQHYACSWGTLLTAISTSSSVAEAGGKLQRAEAGGWRAAS